MKIFFPFILSLVACWGLLSHYGVISRLEEKAEMVNNYERQALTLAKKNRELEAEINELRFSIESLRAENKFLKLNKQTIENSSSEARTPASLKSEVTMKREMDLVKFDIYKWTPETMMAIAEKEFSSKNLEKSSQFFHELIVRFPNHKLVSDKTLFQAGISLYESGKYYPEAIVHLGRLIDEYPTSKFTRGAKLWRALSYLKIGEEDKFAKTVEEFRLKYRNTEEWKILASYINQKKAGLLDGNQ